ncbi:MAG TPA: nucleoside 2-deoxyribosyltransferase [Tissierellaceae bacterium]|nr:nucleoside 2-deoxyribosyltransferase [Tissierellaceae bacterium]
MKVYFANDLFNDATLMYNEHVVSKIEEELPDVEVYLPQRNDAINDKTQYADSLTIVKADYDELEDSDVLVAVIDSDDSGVALEIGMFYMMNKPIIGIYTDTRRIAYGNEQKKEAIDILGENQIAYTNLMVIGAIKERGELVDNHEEAIRLLKNLKSKESL